MTTTSNDLRTSIDTSVPGDSISRENNNNDMEVINVSTSDNDEEPTYKLYGQHNIFIINEVQYKIYNFLTSKRFGKLSHEVVTKLFHFCLDTLPDLYGILGDFAANKAITFLDVHFGLDNYNEYINDLIRLLSLSLALDHQRATNEQTRPDKIWGHIKQTAQRTSSDCRKQLAMAYDQMIRDVDSPGI